YPGLDGSEIALSESQERMAVVIDKENLDSFMEEVIKEDLEGKLVAKVTEEKVVKMNWQGSEIVNIDRDFLDSNGVRKKSKAKLVQPSEDDFLDIISPNAKDQSIEKSISQVLKDINIGSQKGIIENFDNTVGANAVLMPYGGKYMLSPSE